MASFKRVRLCRAYVTAVVLAASGPACADPLLSDSYNLFGVPGLLEMPTAESAADGELSGSLSRLADQQRTTLTFQLTPRISASFRYARIPGYDGPNTQDRFDRSFDARLRLIDEGTWWPAVAIGIQDLIGTGVYSGEYIVATKQIVPGFRVTGGLGWGRLASQGAISDGFGVRTGEFVQTGGVANFDQYFRGPIAPFGGFSLNLTKKLVFKAEYSSDGYTVERKQGIFDYETPWNFGLDYQIAPGIRLTGAYLHGKELGIQFNMSLSPKAKVFGPGSESAPVPVLPRPSRDTSPEAWSTTWAGNSDSVATLRKAVKETLAAEGQTVTAIAVQPGAIEVRYQNTLYSAESQALGRTVRLLSRILPASIETIILVPVVDGLQTSAVTFQRRDIESMANGPGREILSQAVYDGGARPHLPGLQNEPGVFPAFTWSLAPYTELGFFDPDQPLRGDLGVDLKFNLNLTPGVVLSGGFRHRLAGNLDEITRKSNSVLPHVRSDFANYLKQGDPRLEYLYLAWYGRPGENLYSRLTAGVLERMYSGVSGELLWKPVNSRLALGVELNYVQQRDFEGGFGLLDYDVLTGHASAYYDFANGYSVRVDAGRYLAGDYGATFSLDRTFDNGWRVGAYATFTDVPFEEFGEGSFDKGIRLVVPLDSFTNKPTQSRYYTVLSPLTRDGGARLFVGGRLYDRVREVQGPEIDARAGRFWK